MTTPTKGLGRGLDSLLGGQPRSLYRSGVGAIPITAIRHGNTQPRLRIRKDQLEELAASIKANGVIQPIVVRPVPGFPHQFEIVAGERRWQAAQLAGLTEIPAVIRELSDQEAVAVALIENIQREELTPAEEARALGRLVEEFSLTHEQAATAVGRSRAAVTNLIRLLDLPPEIIAMIDAQSIAMGHARALLGLSDNAERVALAKLIVERKLSVRETESRVRRAQKGEESAGSSPARQPSMVSEVMRTPNVRVQLHQRPSGAGKLIIEFTDDVARDALLQGIKSTISE
ncbi:MAG TPA: ParB/RepB/Spo0J family partition protein [Steroidobacteraceae bacterium]|nr:ParB/RepB/Spo0J family partition protein [Steroidobacteraceae bacterium]